MKILSYRMLNPGSTRGAVTDTFYRWLSGQVYSCPDDCPEGEFSHMDESVCLTIREERAPKVQTADVEASNIETRPVTAKRGKAKS